MAGKINRLSSTQKEELLSILKNRFEKNINRHLHIEWDAVQIKLQSNSSKCYCLYQMEITGGEPDVMEVDKKTGDYIFYDCSPESPAGRRSLCYDEAALNARKENKPKNSAMKMAADMGIEILTESAYRYLQQFGKFDTKTSSWIITPDNIRKLGGALFCDRRYDTVFTYHNGADSYYSARGFRGCLKL